MRTAVDTNIVSEIWAATENAERAARLLSEAREGGSLLLCPIVYSELLANPHIKHDVVDQVLEDMGLEVDYNLTAGVWREAGLRFAKQSERRRRSGDGERKRLIADFVVGSHALLQAERLLTFDRKRYVRDFPELKLVGAA